MKLNDSFQSDKVVITVEQWHFSRFVILLLALMVLSGMVLEMNRPETVLLLTIFLFLPAWFFRHQTQLHFNKVDKTLLSVYIIYGRIIRKRKLLEDYTSYRYSIDYEDISNELDTGHITYAYILRATGYYYYHDIFYFETLEMAQMIGEELETQLGLTLVITEK
jgi:hypothetical protein